MDYPLYVNLSNNRELKELLDKLYAQSKELTETLLKLKNFSIRMDVVCEDEIRNSMNIICAQSQEPHQ